MTPARAAPKETTDSWEKGNKKILLLNMTGSKTVVNYAM